MSDVRQEGLEAEERRGERLQQAQAYSQSSYEIARCRCPECQGRDKDDQVRSARRKGRGEEPKTAKDKARKKSYYARHNAQDSKPDILSARY